MALVTGGSRGLGREMVLAMAQAGADVAITSRKVESCKAVAEEVEATRTTGVRPRLPRRPLGRARRPRRRHLRRARPRRRARQQRRHVAAVPRPGERDRGAVRQGGRRQPQGPVPAGSAGRRPHGRGRRRLDHQRQQRGGDPPDAERGALRRRQGRARQPHHRPRPGLRAEGPGELDPVRALLHRHLRSVGQGCRRRDVRHLSPRPGRRPARDRRVPRSTWRATRRASPPAPCCGSTAARPSPTERRERRGARLPHHPLLADVRRRRAGPRGDRGHRRRRLRRHRRRPAQRGGPPRHRRLRRAGRFGHRRRGPALLRRARARAGGR